LKNGFRVLLEGNGVAVAGVFGTGVERCSADAGVFGTGVEMFSAAAGVGGEFPCEGNDESGADVLGAGVER